ncbi:hypothetical protein [Methanimicrococcus hongohii]|nr:hypothetical protein [Methanimicrococcus sp. Hf6]
MQSAFLYPCFYCQISAEPARLQLSFNLLPAIRFAFCVHLLILIVIRWH